MMKKQQQTKPKQNKTNKQANKQTPQPVLKTHFTLGL